MKLGIFGGSFDPVHVGHLILAEIVREACELDQIWFMPAARAPHKQGQHQTSARSRVEMLKLAVAGHPPFQVSDLEMQRPPPSFTVETLGILREQRPEDDLYLLIGADSLNDLLTWREPRRILELATVIAVNRGRVPAQVTPELQALLPQGRDKIRIVEMPGIDLSSTAIRERARAGQSIRYQCPRAVELFIEQQRLYRDEST